MTENKKIIPREYQNKILQTVLNHNTLIILPTGLGKTLIALMTCIELLKKEPTKKILFLAPTKPLVEQHLKYFKDNLDPLFADMQILTGQIKPESRKKIWEESSIIFATPQTIANDLKKNLYNLKEIILLIEDEAHKCIKNYSYNLVAKICLRDSPNARIIGMTASPGSTKEKITEICKNLNIEKIESRTRDSPDVETYLQELKFEKITVDFPPELEEIRQLIKSYLNKITQELKEKKFLFGNPTKTNLLELQKKISFLISKNPKDFSLYKYASTSAQAIKLFHSLDLLETQTVKSFNSYFTELLNQSSKNQSKGLKILTNSKEFTLSLKLSQDYLNQNKEHPKISKAINYIESELKKDPHSKIILFTQFRSTASQILQELKKTNQTKPEIFIGQTKKNNLGLNQKQQEQILKDFKQGKTNILIATSIAEEGLDIPEVSAVIFYEPIPSAIRAIQRAGRTARLKEGKLIIFLTKKTKDETNYYISRNKEKTMRKLITEIEKEIPQKKEYQKNLFKNDFS